MLLPLQEHLVGLMVAQQDQTKLMQLLVAVNASAVLMLLGASGSWAALLVAGSLLALLAWAVGPQLASTLLSSSRRVPGGVLQRGRGVDRQLARGSRSLAAAVDKVRW